MKYRQIIFLILLLADFGYAPITEATQASARTYDVVIYGGTAAAVTAAIQAKRMGKTVVIVSPDKHLGGLSSGGLGFTDTGDKSVIGGLAREFYHRIWMHYNQPTAWVWEKREQYGNKGQGTPAIDGEQRTMWIFEPHVAERVFEDLIKENHIPSTASNGSTARTASGRVGRASLKSKRSAASATQAGCSSTRPMKAI